MINKNYYVVESRSKKDIVYDIGITKHGMTCTCKDHEFKKSRCAHICAVEFLIGFGADFEPKSMPETATNMPSVTCPGLHDMNHIVRSGVRRNRHYSVQMFYCKKCRKKFSENLGFERIKASPTMATLALNMFFNGESLRDVADSLELLGQKVTRKTVANWIKRFVTEIHDYVQMLSPQLSEDWQADEIFIKFLGKTNYVYSLMDEQTRYWISQQIACSKGTLDIRSLLKDGYDIAKKKPESLITDGAPNFHAAWNHEYRAKNPKQKKTQHIRHVHFNGDHNTNKIERLNGEIRDREKTMRGLKSKTLQSYRACKYDIILSTSMEA